MHPDLVRGCYVPACHDARGTGKKLGGKAVQENSQSSPDGFPTFPTASRRLRRLPDGFPTLGPSRALGLPSFEGPSVSFPMSFQRRP